MIVRTVVFGRKMDLVVSKENGVISSILTVKQRPEEMEIGLVRQMDLKRMPSSVFSQDKDFKCLR